MEQQKKRRKKSDLARADHFSDDGHKYRINRTESTIRYMKCTTPFCHGTAKMIANANGTWDWSNNDNHDVHCFTDKKELECARFKDAIQDSLSRHYNKLKDIYNTFAAIYPQAAQQVPYATLLPSMKIWRKNNYPSNPTNINQLGEQIKAIENTTIFEGIRSYLTTQEIVDEDGCKHILFYDEKLIRDNFQDVEHLLMDATYDTTPKMPEETNLQLFSIMGIKYGHAMTFVYCLMTRKTEKAYDAVLNHIKRILPAHKVKIVMTDFETALRNAIEKAFPNARCVGCNVHFDRAIYRKIKSLNLTDYLENNSEAKLFIKKVTTLAFLPSEQIKQEFITLCNNTDKRIKQKLSKFIKYFYNFWLNRVKPENFSIFGLLVRTNNAIEASHSQLKHRLGEHPAVWDFICRVRLLLDYVWFDIERLRSRKRVSRQPRYQTIYRQTEILRAQEVLDLMASLKGNLCERIKRAQKACDENFVPSGKQYTTLDPDFDDKVLDALTQAGALTAQKERFENPDNVRIEDLFDAPAHPDEDRLSDAEEVDSINENAQILDHSIASPRCINANSNSPKQNISVQNEENVPYFYRNPLRERNISAALNSNNLDYGAKNDMTRRKQDCELPVEARNGRNELVEETLNHEYHLKESNKLTLNSNKRDADAKGVKRKLPTIKKVVTLKGKEKKIKVTMESAKQDCEWSGAAKDGPNELVNEEMNNDHFSNEEINANISLPKETKTSVTTEVVEKRSRIVKRGRMESAKQDCEWSGAAKDGPNELVNEEMNNDHFSNEEINANISLPKETKTSVTTEIVEKRSRIAKRGRKKKKQSSPTFWEEDYELTEQDVREMSPDVRREYERLKREDLIKRQKMDAVIETTERRYFKYMGCSSDDENMEIDSYKISDGSDNADNLNNVDGVGDVKKIESAKEQRKVFDYNSLEIADSVDHSELSDFNNDDVEETQSTPDERDSCSTASSKKRQRKKKHCKKNKESEKKRKLRRKLRRKLKKKALSKDSAL